MPRRILGPNTAKLEQVDRLESDAKGAFGFISTFFGIMGIESRSPESRHADESPRRAQDTQYQLYPLNGNGTRRIEFRYYPVPWGSSVPLFSVVYSAEIATTPKQIQKLYNSSLLRRIKSLQQRPAGVEPHYLNRIFPDGIEGIVFMAKSVNPADDVLWKNLAVYTKKVDDLVVRYIAGKLK